MVKKPRSRPRNEDSGEGGGTLRLAPDAALQQLTFDVKGVLELIDGDGDSASPEVTRALELVAGLLREALDRLEPAVEESAAHNGLALPLPGLEPGDVSETLPEVQVVSLRDLLARVRSAGGAVLEGQQVHDAAIEVRFAE